MTESGYVTYGSADHETAIATVLEVDAKHPFLVRRTQVTFRTATGELCDHEIDWLSAGLCREVLAMLNREGEQ